MKRKQNKSIFPLLIVGVFLIFASSCKNDEGYSQTKPEFNPKVIYGTMTDLDSNVYKTVTIGKQTWMAENLRTTKYNDGSAIPNVTEKNKWYSLRTGAYCNYENTTNINTITTYGRLYNWYAVNTNMLAPKGWHVPSDVEWKELIDYLGGDGVAGGKLKEAGISHWQSPNTGATNESGFTALPSGNRGDPEIKSTFFSIKEIFTVWSATEFSSDYAWRCYLFYEDGYVNRNYVGKSRGFSVRCVKD